MIGLWRGVVSLSAHRADWLKLGADACQKVEQACGHLPIVVEHVGSTSVPGLIAKPILDLALGLPNTALIGEVIGLLTKAGFIYRGEGEGSVGFLFVWESEPDVRTIHLHAVQYPSAHWDDYIVLRDILRADPQILRSYEELKKYNAQKFAHDRKQYTSAKAKFVREVIASGGRG